MFSQVEDEGIYKCRTDFKRSPTKNSKMYLSILSKLLRFINRNYQSTTAKWSSFFGSFYINFYKSLIGGYVCFISSKLLRFINKNYYYDNIKWSSFFDSFYNTYLQIVIKRLRLNMFGIFSVSYSVLLVRTISLLV